MQAALLFDLTGEFDGEGIESDVNGSFPAVDAEATQYLDGLTLFHGEAAARVTEEREMPVPKADEIQTEEMERTRRHCVDWYADPDPETGWVGISSSAGAWFVDEYLPIRYEVRGEPLEIDLEQWIEDFVDEDSAQVWGLTYSVEVNDETTRAGSDFHRDADLSQLERDAADVSGVGFRYRWDGWTRGVIYESGYVAIYNPWDESMFGRWLHEHVLPYAAYSTELVETVQTTLGEAPATDQPADAAEEAEEVGDD